MNTNFLKPNVMKTTKYFLSALLCFSFFVSCSDDDDGGNVEEPNEEEVITDVTLTFVNNADMNDVVTLQSIDPDGEDGPVAPTVTISGPFTAGATYTATVDLFNSIEMEDITVEVTDVEPDEHFFIYFIDGLDMTFARSANDVMRSDGNLLGFETTWTANSAGTGDILIQLFHQSTTVNDDANGGLGTQEGGSTDVNVNFENVMIQ